MFSSQGVVTDRTLQELLGRLLEGEQGEFYVNARRTQRNSQSQKLYKYSFSDPAIKMFQQTSRVRGDCLTVSSHQGHLQSAGELAGRRPPWREGRRTGENVTGQSRRVLARRWVSLSFYKKFYLLIYFRHCTALTSAL